MDARPLQSDLRITSLSAAFKAGSLALTDLVNLVYDGIAAYHDKSVWIHLVPREVSLDRARNLATDYPDRTSRPVLFGIPFSIKDSIDVAGMPTTLACPSFAYTAETTASVVERALEHGAILIGKTNLDQFATGLTGTRSPYGAPRCVHDEQYISGGSSSGSAVSVAASLVSFTICTDTGGSVRVPAALNGVVGLKPSLGSVSTFGLFPACKNIDCVCTIAQTVDDAETVWNVLKGFDVRDVYSRRRLPEWAPWHDPTRFGLPPEEALSALSSAYRSLFDDFVSTMRGSQGFIEAKLDYRPFEAANEMLYNSPIVAQRLLAFRSYTDHQGLDLLHPDIKSTFISSYAMNVDALEAYNDIFELVRHKRDAESQFDGLDIIVVPSTVCHWTLTELQLDPVGRNKILGKFTSFVNLLDLCAIAVPTSTWQSVNGKAMSFGVTVIGQAGKERDVMDVGRRIMAMSQGSYSP